KRSRKLLDSADERKSSGSGNLLISSHPGLPNLIQAAYQLPSKCICTSSVISSLVCEEGINIVTIYRGFRYLNVRNGYQVCISKPIHQLQCQLIGRDNCLGRCY
ncbi:hypothetical protein EWB00_000872, partial [Schistosoma japonicum]